MKTIELFLPGLLDTLPLWQQDFGFNPHTPLLSTLLHDYQTEFLGGRGLERSLFGACGLPPDDELPVAYYRFLAGSNKSSTEIKEYVASENPPANLICADPVHCEAGMTDITLTESVTDLTESEADEILDLLNTHFYEDGLTFLRNPLQDAATGHYSHWYVSVESGDRLITKPPGDVMRKNIFAYLPMASGENRSGRNWHALQNEIQMLLYSADINRRREIAAQNTINNLWFWGAGAPFNSKTRYNRVIGGGLNGQMLAMLNDCEWHALPPQVEDLAGLMTDDSNKTSVMAIVFDQLREACWLDDTVGWQQIIDELETGYLASLLGLKTGRSHDRSSYEKVVKQLSGSMQLIINPCDGKRLSCISERGMMSRLKSLFGASHKPSLLDLVK